MRQTTRTIQPSLSPRLVPHPRTLVITPPPLTTLFRHRPPLQLNHHSLGKVNLVSYEDAGFAVVAALDAGIAQIKDESGAAPEIKGKVFLAADHSPTTRRKICEVALGHPLYARKSMPKFTQDASPPEFAETGAKKVYDSSETRRVLGWEPQCSSMEEYFRVEMEQELAMRE